MIDNVQATPKQIGYIKGLINRLVDNDPDLAAQFYNGLLERGLLDTKVLISSTIDDLVKRVDEKRAAGKPAAVIAAPGMYRLPDGTIYKVQIAVHGSKQPYAKRLVPPTTFGGTATFVYAPGMVWRLTPADKLSLEDAKAFGALYGSCCVCGRTLTDERSIAAGIGPVCAGRLT